MQGTKVRTPQLYVLQIVKTEEKGSAAALFQKVNFIFLV